MVLRYISYIHFYLIGQHRYMMIAIYSFHSIWCWMEILKVARDKVVGANVVEWIVLKCKKYKHQLFKGFRASILQETRMCQKVVIQ